MRITMTKEIMVKKIEDLCKAEGITTVKEFRSFFEYWIIGWGEMDDDFSYEAKRIEKTLTAAQWKKGYSLVTDEDIESCLAKKEEIIENVKKYVGYGYHGGGRKATGIKRVSICISGQPEQIEKLKKMAAQEEKTVSAFIFEKTGINKMKENK